MVFVNGVVSLSEVRRARWVGLGTFRLGGVGVFFDEEGTAEMRPRMR